MGTKPSICFIGNCQAETMSSIVNHFGLDFELILLPPVFDISQFKTRKCEDLISSADFIFCQRVSEDYEVEFIRPSAIKSLYGQKSRLWPNIYFDGYFPGIEYIYTPNGKLTGPLSDYHFRALRQGWDDGVPAAELTEGFLRGELAAFPSNPVERSLNMLRDREVGLDVPISDYIATRFRSRKMFYSMNHPDNGTLIEMMTRLFGSVGLPWDASREPLISSFPYTLNQIDIPCLPWVHQRYGMWFDQPDQVRGRELRIDENYAGEGSEARIYDWRDVVEAYFSVYSAERRMGA